MAVLKVPVNDDDGAEIRAAAKRLALKVAAFMRMAALEKARKE